MEREQKPAVAIDVTVRIQLTQVERDVGWPTHWIVVDGQRIATACLGSKSRLLIGGRVLQYDLVATNAAIVRQIESSDMDRPVPAEAATDVETESDAGTRYAAKCLTMLAAGLLWTSILFAAACCLPRNALALIAINLGLLAIVVWSLAGLMKGLGRWETAAAPSVGTEKEAE